MADWYGHSRSNYFKITDVEKFKDLCDTWGIELISDEQDAVTDKCIHCMKKVPNKECSEYVKRMVDQCDGKKEKQELYGFLGSDNNGNLPNYRCEDHDDGTTTEYDFDNFLEDLAPLIADDWVAIMFEVGAEKLRYITGFAVAINSKGEKRIIDICDMYDKSVELGKYTTAVEH